MSVTLTPPRKTGRYNVARFGFENVVGLSDASVVQQTIRTFMRQGLDTLIVNLQGVKDVDKAGWDCLVSAARRLHKTGGRVILRHCPDDLYTQLEAHRWDREFLVPDRRADDAAAVPEEVCGLYSADAGPHPADGAFGAVKSDPGGDGPCI